MKKENTDKKPEDLQEIVKVYRLMVKEGLSEINWERGGNRLTIKRKTSAAALPAVQEIKHVKRPQGQPEAPVKEKKDNTVPIKSPMNGVVYRSSSPDSDPFVKEGDSVSGGQTVCIIEAMKSMNEIKAENSCKIIKILVSNAESVTSGQDIFLVLPQ